MEELLSWRPHFNMPSIPGVVLIVVSLLIYKLTSRIEFPGDESKAAKKSLILRLACVILMAAGAVIAIYF